MHMAEGYSSAVRAIGIGACIGIWGLVAGFSSVVSMEKGGGDDSQKIVALMVTYSLMMTILPVFILIGAYASSSLGKNQSEALGLAFGSSIIGFALATLSGLGTLGLAMSANGFSTEGLISIEELIAPFLLALFTGFMGALFRILSTIYEDHGYDDEMYSD